MRSTLTSEAWSHALLHVFALIELRPIAYAFLNAIGLEF